MEPVDSESMIASLGGLVGEWSVRAPAFGDGSGRTVFEWMAGERFLIQRFSSPAPAPGGLAVIGVDEGTGELRQHYFDSRGVARLYEMSLRDGVWELRRESADFSPLSFSQRFSGTFDERGDTIAGRWEHTRSGSWELDFELIYTRVG